MLQLTVVLLTELNMGGKCALCGVEVAINGQANYLYISRKSSYYHVTLISLILNIWYPTDYLSFIIPILLYLPLRICTPGDNPFK